MARPTASSVASRLVKSTGLLIHHYEALLRMANSPSNLEQAARPLVAAYCTTGQHDRAKELLRQYKPGPAAYEPLLLACVHKGDDRGLREATQLMRDTECSPDGSTYGVLMEARLARGELWRALRVCDAALAAGKPPPSSAVHELISALSAAGLSGSALELLTELRVRHGLVLQGHEAATQALLDRAAQSHAMPLEVLAVHQELKEHISQSRMGEDTLYGTGLQDELMQRCVQAGNLRGARALLTQLEKEGGALGPGALDALLRALLDASKIGEAERLFTQAATWRTREGRAAVPWASASPSALRVSAPGAHDARPSCDAAHVDPVVSLDHLDLRALPEGAAQISALRFFQRLATEAMSGHEETEASCSEAGSTPAFPSRVELVMRASHSDAVIRLAQGLSPPLELQAAKSAGSPSDVTLFAEGDELSQWSEQVMNEWRKSRRTNDFALAAVSHNALWTLALLAWVGL